MRTVNPEQHAAKRARIVDAAADVFARAGFDGVSTQQICAHAGIGSGTLFHYFSTKDAVFRAVFILGLERNGPARRRALAAEDPRDGLDDLLRHLIQDLDDPRSQGLAAACVHRVHRDPELARALIDDERQTLAALERLLRACAERGRVTQRPPDQLARWILRLIDAGYLMTSPDRHHSRVTTELRDLIAVLIGD